jgi:uncharacterized membrane protein
MCISKIKIWKLGEVDILSKGHRKVYIIISIILFAVICFGIYRYRIAKYNNGKKNKTDVTNVDKKTGQKSKSKENGKKYEKSTSTDTENVVKSEAGVSDGSQKNITVEQAVKTASECYGDKNKNTKFVFDHETVRDNIHYYVIQVFDSMEDHSATSGWYYINKKNGKAYEWDLNEDKLIPVN